ncbi:MAG: radical SAM protein [Oscillospiraceae bacterium]|nr:radical SAM protein [Oscillospiraceae bacterium]
MLEPRISKYLHDKATRQRLPINGTFELTARCNFNCPMCYVHLSAEEQQRRGRELTGEEWIDIAEQAKRAGTLFLLLTGGEPTVHPEFVRIYERLSEMGFYLSMNSNGRLLEGDLLELFRRKPPERLNITLYATDNAGYQKQCGVPAYDRVVRNIRALREAGVFVRVNLTITPANREEMEELVAKGKELGAVIMGTTYIWPQIRVDETAVGKSFRPSPEEAGRAMAVYDSLRMPHEDFVRRGKQILAGIPQQTLSEEDCEIGSRMLCRAGKATYWIDWQGNMTPCALMPIPSVSVMQAGFDKAWQTLLERVLEIRLPPECAACEYRRICNPCAAKCYTETGSFHTRPDYVCRFTKSFLEATREAVEREDNA